MTPQVTTAVISGSVALLTALLGITGAIAAQLIATRRAFANALAVQARQHAEQQAERQEQARRDDAYRFAEQRRTTYARFLHAADEIVKVSDDIRRLVLADSEAPPEDGSEESQDWADKLNAESSAARARMEPMEPAARTLTDEIALIASAAVASAAVNVLNMAINHMRMGLRPDLHANPDDRLYEAARAGFIRAARTELGVAHNPANPPAPDKVV